MRKPNKKNVLIVILSLAVLGFIVFFLFGENVKHLIHRWANSSNDVENKAAEPAHEVQEYYKHPDAVAVDAAYSCDGHYYYGDEGFLIKANLLDPSVANQYKALPDTILRIPYGTQLQQANEKSVEFYDKKARFEPLNPPADQVLTSYLKLAAQGKVEYLCLPPNRQGSLELEDQCDFKSKYANYFDPKIGWQRAVPLSIKEVLIDYFESDEGGKYSFVSDRRNIQQVVVPGTFSGLNQYTHQPNKELAVVLTQKEYQGSYRERLLVIGYDDKNYKGYILYNEDFYGNKILIKKYSNPTDLPEEAASLRKYVSSTHQLLEIETDNGERFYLYYETEFDTMSKKSFQKEDTAYEDCGGC